MNEYGNVGAAVMIYDSSQLVGGLALTSVWTHASKHHLLVSKSLTETQIKTIKLHSYVPSIVFLITLAIAALFSFSYQYLGISPGFANFTLIGIPPLMRVATRKSKSG